MQPVCRTFRSVAATMIPSGSSLSPGLHGLLLTSLLLTSPAALADEPSGAADTQKRKLDGNSAEDPSRPENRELFRGRVVLLRDAMKKRGITAFSEWDGQVVLEKSDGSLLPIVPDWRGRAFFQDTRLRDRDVELIGIRRPGLPFVQVLMVFTFDPERQRQYTDYWCDICSIPMYEIKPCDCCQGEIRLRFQPRALPAWIRKQTDHAQP